MHAAFSNSFPFCIYFGNILNNVCCTKCQNFKVSIISVSHHHLMMMMVLITNICADITQICISLLTTYVQFAPCGIYEVSEQQLKSKIIKSEGKLKVVLLFVQALVEKWLKDLEPFKKREFQDFKIQCQTNDVSCNRGLEKI